ncbi:MAG: PorP/SprF family type IX secretion system membrane protein [Bacteroidota bacterium]
MKKAQLFFTLLLLLATVSLSAQEETIFNHYVQSPIILNPGAAGFDEEYQLQINARAAWTGFDDSPTTLGVRLSGPVGNNFGIGAAVFSESAAQLSRVKGQLDVAFRFGFGPELEKDQPAFQAAFGFFTQFQRIQVDASVMDNPLQQAGDELLMDFINGVNEFDAGFGLYGSFRRNTFGGITINNLVSNRLANISGETTESGFNYTFLLGHHFDLPELKVKLTPSIMMRNVQNAPFMLDFNLQAAFLDEQLIAGLSYRYLGALGLLLGTKLESLRIYYSYDLSFATFQQYNNGSHEITLGYHLDRKKLQERRRIRREQQSTQERR